MPGLTRADVQAHRTIMGIFVILQGIERFKQMKHCEAVILSTTDRKRDDDLATVSRGKWINNMMNRTSSRSALSVCNKLRTYHCD